MPPSRRPPTSRADADRIGGPKVARSLPGGKRQDRRERSMPPGRALPFQIRQAAARRKLSLPIPSLCRRYARPRDAEHAVLYRVIDEHLEAFLETARRNADASPLPEFVEQEFRDFLTCGVLAHGFARLRCTDCAFERFVPFSCKGRGFCPSCGGRRMTECAARLVDEVLPRVPGRQWVLSLPYRLRYLLAWDHALARAVLGVFVRVLLGFQRHRARRSEIRNGRSGCVTVIQRFGGGLNLNIHFHTLLFDGVFWAKGEEGLLEFRPLPPPTDDEVDVVLARIAERVQRLLERRVSMPAVPTYATLIPWSKNLPRLPASAAPRFRGESRWGLARAPACGAWGTIPTRRGCSRPPPGTRISRASICTRTSPCRPRIARAWNSSAVICSARQRPRTGSGSWTMAASCSRSRPRGRTARASSCTSRSRCSRSWPRSPHGRGSTSCSTTACSRRMPAGGRAWSLTACRRWRRRWGRAPPQMGRTTRRRRRSPGTGHGPI